MNASTFIILSFIITLWPIRVLERVSVCLGATVSAVLVVQLSN